MTFPTKLDNATVLLYTDNDDFGYVTATDGSFVIPIRFLAICQYQNDDIYYLFLCNKELEVETDYLFDSIDEAKDFGYEKNRNIHWHSHGDYLKEPAN